MTDTTTAGEILVQDTLGPLFPIPAVFVDLVAARLPPPAHPHFSVRDGTTSAIVAFMKFPLHTYDSAPEESRHLLTQVQGAFGFVPHLTATLAESPAALAGYLQLSSKIQELSALSPQEQQIVMLAVSEANGCDYCMAAHSLIAGLAQVPQETVAALRACGDLPDPKQAALAKFARTVVDHRGWVPETDQEAFLAAGFTPRQLLDVVAIVSLKTLSNYANHLAHTPLDQAFEPHRWTKAH